MEKYHYLKRITKSDLYKVLRYKYPLSFQRIAKRNKQHEIVIFKETIDQAGFGLIKATAI